MFYFRSSKSEVFNVGFDTSASVRGQKEKMGVLAVDVEGWRSCVCGAEN